ncbi:DUF3888 domain-containing protein [Lentibacillus cibarius]|uniref:DUF3888 domain-containing protein n=1 Tax=Lentibacillus cibarius TaxID=2583219 RepID=UPI002694CF27
MSLKHIVVFMSLLTVFMPYTVHAEEQTPSTAEEFDIDLTGYQQYPFSSFYQLGNEITPLAQIYFGIIQKEQTWMENPRMYIKGNKGYVHLWKEDGTNVLYHIQKRENGMWEIMKVNRKKIDRIPVPKKLLKEALIERLIKPISQAIDDYYGESKLWYRGLEKVLEIKKDEQNHRFTVTVQVQTFEGPHNPPYGEETITFSLKGDEAKVVNFDHRDIPKKEWAKKLQLR